MLTYFVEKQRFTSAQAKEILPGRFGKSIHFRNVSGGPEKKSGVVFSSCEKHCSYQDSQTWVSLGQFKTDSKPIEVWVGYEKIEPEKLLRGDDQVLSGHRVLLAGNQWMIPMAREWRESDGGKVFYDIALPQSAKYDQETGGWYAGEVQQKYRYIFDHATKVYENYVCRDDGKFTLPDDSLSICADLISCNYRIGPQEISALGLLQFNFECAWSILRLLIDEPGLIEITNKKKASGGN